MCDYSLLALCTYCEYDLVCIQSVISLVALCSYMLLVRACVQNVECYLLTVESIPLLAEASFVKHT